MNAIFAVGTKQRQIGRAALVAMVLIGLSGGTAYAQVCNPHSGGAACASTLRFRIDRNKADADLGWTGQDHDKPFGGDLTVAVSGCAGSTYPNCGQCTVSGPLVNAVGTPVGNQRCTGNTSVACTTNAPCAGIGTCGFFLGAPLPLGIGGVGVCVATSIAGAVTGTTNLSNGTSALNMSLNYELHTGPVLSQPCPTCVGDGLANDGIRGGTCSGGPRNGLTCDSNATTTPYSGTTSFDCPLDPATNIGVLPLSLALSTGTQSRVLSAANPNCRAGGWTSKKCFCETCNNAAGTPCSSNADCVAVGATTCGGKRCLSGANAGTPCAVNSECASTTCGTPGTQSAANDCSDGVCTANTPPDNDSVNEGECAAGPFENFCAIETFRQCSSGADCPASGDSCTAGKFRECFTDNGDIGGTVSVAGAPSLPCDDDSSKAGLGALFCASPTASAAANIVLGLPGLGRITLNGFASPTEGPFGDPSCSDGLDNDGDGQIDAADPGCAPIHEGPPGNPTCSDGIDNDGNGFVDGNDRGCQPNPPEVCNGFDDNGNGQVDEGFPDSDGDGIADCVDLDQDNDGVRDGEDNCVNTPNPNQSDTDHDGIGDACDSNTPPVVNPPSAHAIVIDGQFEPGAGEWADVTPISFLSGASKVYTSLDPGQDAIYLMYDFSLSTNPLALGDEVGPVTFQVGNSSIFDVYIIQGGPDTNFGPHPATSQGGAGDHVRVMLNGQPFDNTAGCVAGAVDFNTTSPNFPGVGHNVAELEVHLTGSPGGCYSPEPAFWSASLPGVQPIPPPAPIQGGPRTGGSNQIFTVSEAFVNINTGSGATSLFPVGADPVLCPSSPDVCRLPFVPAKASVLLQSKTKVVPNDKNQVVWKWSNGTATTLGEFGDPLNTDDYAFCVYDGTGLVAQAAAPHGGTCAGKPCWSGNATGLKYKDKDLTPDGISQIVLKSGVDGKAKVLVKTKGPAFPMPNLAALTSPLKVQLRKSSGGPCWGAVYSFPPAQKNDATTFKDKAD